MKVFVFLLLPVLTISAPQVQFQGHASFLFLLIALIRSVYKLAMRNISTDKVTLQDYRMVLVDREYNTRSSNVTAIRKL